MADYTALYLENEVRDQSILKKELSIFNVEVAVVFGLNDFFCEALNSRPDILIIGNPPSQSNMSALEILEKLKADRALHMLDVILLAEQSAMNKGERRIALAKGALAYIVKPVDIINATLIILSVSKSRFERKWGCA